MTEKIVKIHVFRFNPSIDPKPALKTYDVPSEPGMSAMDALDYIYQNLDGTLSYYDHAGCSLGICGKCTGKINGKPGLFCQTPVDGDLTLEPFSKENLLKDLVMNKKDTRSKQDKKPKQ